eukprot:COSAG01_NODE_433_length_17113_cov_23.009757_16_plen_93_part_00
MISTVHVFEPIHLAKFKTLPLVWCQGTKEASIMRTGQHRKEVKGVAGDPVHGLALIFGERLSQPRRDPERSDAEGADVDRESVARHLDGTTQ